jgi:hypothetical protein
VGNRINLTGQLRFPHSLGMLYSAFTYYCGFKVNSGEYKLMGLAPYGKPAYQDAICGNLVDLKPDGTLWLNMDYLNYCQGSHDLPTLPRSLRASGVSAPKHDGSTPAEPWRGRAPRPTSLRQNPSAAVRVQRPRRMPSLGGCSDMGGPEIVDPSPSYARSG